MEPLYNPQESDLDDLAIHIEETFITPFHAFSEDRSVIFISASPLESSLEVDSPEPEPEQESVKELSPKPVQDPVQPLKLRLKEKKSKSKKRKSRRESSSSSSSGNSTASRSSSNSSSSQQKSRNRRKRKRKKNKHRKRRSSSSSHTSENCIRPASFKNHKKHKKRKSKKYQGKEYCVERPGEELRHLESDEGSSNATSLVPIFYGPSCSYSSQERYNDHEKQMQLIPFSADFVDDEYQNEVEESYVPIGKKEENFPEEKSENENVIKEEQLDWFEEKEETDSDSSY